LLSLPFTHNHLAVGVNDEGVTVTEADVSVGLTEGSYQLISPELSDIANATQSDSMPLGSIQLILKLPLVNVDNTAEVGAVTVMKLAADNWVDMYGLWGRVSV